MANLKDLIVNGVTRLLGHLYVNGDAKISGDQTIDGGQIVKGYLYVSGGLNPSGGFDSSLVINAEGHGLLSNMGDYGKQNLIRYDSNSGTMYQSGASSFDSTYGVTVGNVFENTRILGGSYIYLTAYSAVSANSTFTYSDSKIKKFTNDIDEDKDKIVALFDLINIKSYTRKDAKYPSQSTLNTGICAQELEEHMNEVGLDNEKYNLIDNHYHFYIERGNGEEDMKYYTRFMTVNYNGLYNLSIVKMRDMEEKHIARLTDLEERVSNLEKK